MKKDILKKFIVLFSLVFVLFGFNFVFAEDIPPSVPVNVHLKIISNKTSFYDLDISVNACDSDSNSETPDTVTPYCAVLQSGLSVGWNWDWAPGVYIDSIENVAGYTSQDSGGKDVYHYWSWSLNGNYAEVGLNYYDESDKLKNGDSILLEFIDPVEIVPEVVADEPVHHSSSGSSVGSYVNTDKTEKDFSIPNALSFLSTNQNVDGSFSSPLYTDWVAVGVGGLGDEAQSFKDKISNYFKNDKFGSSIITDYERHAMALMSLGVDPYAGTDVNSIDKIVSSYDGVQLGDPSLLNDDIFGLIVLYHTGYKSDDEIIRNVVSYLILKQSPDDSWGSIDITSASLQALSNFPDLSGVSESISRGESYLKKEQKENGSFDDNSFSTSWAIQALSLNNSLSSEVDEAIKYLVDLQQDDGGLSGENKDNRIWATSYAIPAVMRLSWNNILKSFSKKENIKKIPLTVSIDKIEKPKEAHKKINKEKNIIEDANPLLIKENSSDNLLSANAIGATQNTKVFSSVINKILQKIAFPFISLWVLPGF